MKPKDRLIIALDVDKEEKAVKLARTLSSEVKLFKIGLELFSSCGPAVVNKIKGMGCEIFLDLKFHDIPNTVAKAARVATKLGVYMFNVHALGGYDMMKAASKAVRDEAKTLKIERPKVLAVTILTNMDQNGLKNIGIDDNIEAEVLRLAMLAKEAGLDGVVASPREAGSIRKKLGKDFLIVTPGVRPAAADFQDQKRVATPKEAIDMGADYIVVGRPITEAEDPAEAARKILQEIK